MNYKLFVLILCLTAFFTQPTFAKKKEVKGRVTAFNKIPLHKVSIVSKSMTAEVLSDEDGYFSFTCDEKEKVSFTANGFFSEKIKLADFAEQDSVNVDLRFKKGKKNFEVATGYGHISERQLSYAIDHLEAGPDYSHYTTIAEALKGKVPGVTVGFNGINIRGTTSINEGPVNALLVVDGSIIDYAAFVNIPPATVKSISVLKGAGAARYGSRGMGGVVVVKTKSKN